MHTAPLLGALPPGWSVSQNVQRADALEVLQSLPAGSVDAIVRGETPSGIELTTQLQAMAAQIQRGILSSTSNLPIRENLESEVRVLVPPETPFRNMVPRVEEPGGLATAWRQITSLGGGWAAGDQPGEGAGAAQVFFAENGAPAELTTVYAAKSASFKLLGQRGSVTGFAQATGRNFQNQYDRERLNAIMNTLLNEENALINGSATSTAAPWGDGTTALGFNGMVNLVTTANGTPSGQVQTSVGALTFAHIDAQLISIWKRGGSSCYILCNAQEALSIKNIALASGSIHRVVMDKGNLTLAGAHVTGYVHPITGEIVGIVVSRFVPAGTMIFGAQRNAIGQATLEVGVLPQVQLPQLAPNQMIQGYTAQEIAPGWDTPQVFGFLVSVYEVLKMHDATVYAKSTGLTAV